MFWRVTYLQELISPFHLHASPFPSLLPPDKCFKPYQSQNRMRGGERQGTEIILSLKIN